MKKKVEKNLPFLNCFISFLSFETQVLENYFLNFSKYHSSIIHYTKMSIFVTIEALFWSWKRNANTLLVSVNTTLPKSILWIPGRLKVPEVILLQAAYKTVYFPSKPFFCACRRPNRTYDYFIIIRSMLQVSESGENGSTRRKVQAFGQLDVVLQPERQNLVARCWRNPGNRWRRYFQALQPNVFEGQLETSFYENNIN